MRTRAASFMLACIWAVLTVPVEGAQQRAPERGTSDASKVARAEELIRQARKAAGSEEALRNLTSLSGSGELRRFVKYMYVKSPAKVEEREKVLKGKISIELLLPDKYRLSVSTSTIFGTRYSYAEVVNGAGAWRDPPLTAEPSSKKRHVIDVRDFERSLAYQALGARQQLTIYSLAWLVQGLPSYPIDRSYEGWLQAKDGKAEAIRVSGADNFLLWFLLDQETRLPVGFIGSVVASQAEPVLLEGSYLLSSNYLRSLQERTRQERAIQAAKPLKRFELQVLLSDRRRVAGMFLPHRLTVMVDGRRVEEVAIAKFEVGRRLNPKKFEQKPPAGTKTRSR